VVLVDKNDKELGTAEILTAHQGKGLKHRAISVVLWRKKAGKIEVLMQKRARGKAVFRQIWGNTCCTNLRPGDEYIPRAVSRLKEEMGIERENQDLEVLYQFSYEAPDSTRKGWCENELDSVVVGEYEGGVAINLGEAEDFKWIEWEELKRAIEERGEEFAPWWKEMIRDKRLDSYLIKQRRTNGKD